jgi:RimJ/RimL family protein N-acetyltransferase
MLREIPELLTRRLRLRGWRENDVEPLAAINADPRVGEWLGGTLTEDETRQRITAYLYAWKEEGFGM